MLTENIIGAEALAANGVTPVMMNAYILMIVTVGVMMTQDVKVHAVVGQAARTNARPTASPYSMAASPNAILAVLAAR